MSDAQPLAATVDSALVLSRQRSLTAREGRIGDRVLRYGTLTLVIVTLAIIAGVAWVITSESLPTIQVFGFRFLSNPAFDPNNNSYGVGPAIFGTFVTSAIAMILAIPLGVGAAIFLVEVAPRPIRPAASFFVDLLATLPSIVLGVWGVLVFVPWMQRTGEPGLHRVLGFLPFFQGVAQGVGLLTAGLILTVMVMPLIISVSREVMLIVPNEQREALLAIGATRWEVIRYAILPFAAIGIFGSFILGLGRALGETMVVTMLVGNQASKISPHLFDTGYTLSSVIANQFNEATPGLFRAAVIEAGFILLIITMITNLLARILVARLGRHRAGGFVA